MADRTHSHDTSMPAMSAETVPSEEFVLVPREPTPEMLNHAQDLVKAGDGMSWNGRSPQMMFAEAWRAMIAAAPTLSASHLAKEGGEAGAVEAAYREGHGDALLSSMDVDTAWDASTAKADLASHSQPSPALAKGVDIVREIAADLERSAGKPLVGGSWGGLALEPVARAIAQDRGALSTPTEGPASVVPVSAATYDVLDEAKINALPLPLIARFAGDKDWLPIHDIGVDAPLCRIDVSGKLEPRRFSEIMELKDGDGVIHNPDDFYLDADTPTEGPASQTEGMGEEALRDVRLDSEKAEEWPAAQKALWRVVTGENLNDGHYINAYRLTEKLYAAIAALTPPETAEAVLVGAGVKPFVYLRENDMRELAMPASRSRDTRIYRVPTFEGEKLHPLYSLPEVSRLQEELERRLRVGELLGEAFEANKIALVAALRECDDAVKALGEARAATASDPAPATDDRERLVEANHRLMNLLYLADEALMELHGCFPNDEVTEEQRRLKQTCKAIRALTGEDYLNRKGRAAVARAALATEASR